MDAVGRGASADSVVLTGKLGTQLDVLGQQIRQFRLPDDKKPEVNDKQPAATREAVPTH